LPGWTVCIGFFTLFIGEMAQLTTSKGIPLAATVDDDQAEAELAEVKRQCKQVFKRLNQHSEPRASIESGPFTLQ
jgi:vesicle transport protein SEC22